MMPFGVTDGAQSTRTEEELVFLMRTSMGALGTGGEIETCTDLMTEETITIV